MPFTFTDGQWVDVRAAIERAGGEATDAVKVQLETAITDVFNSGSQDVEIIEALRRVSKSAHALSSALRDLARACHAEERGRFAPRPDVIDNDVRTRLSFARQAQAWAEGADFTLDKSYRAFNVARRGRPNDTKPTALARALLRLAKDQGWPVADGRGRTSAEISQLMSKLMDCAQAAGLTHVRDRRAMTRALAQARSDEKELNETPSWLIAELDALASREP